MNRHRIPLAVLGLLLVCAMARGERATSWPRLEAAEPYSLTNQVPFFEAFEDFADGYAIALSPGWYIDARAAVDTGRVTTNPAVVSALTNYTNGGGTLPANTTHAKVLSLGGALALSIGSLPGEPVRTDMMLQPCFSDERPAFAESYQGALIFNTNGQAEIFTRDPLSDQHEWITLTNGPTMVTGVWTRVTILHDYSNNMYQVRLNESAPIADDRGWNGPPPGAAQPGAWFHMASDGGRLAELAFHGDGEAYLDDLVIGGLLPRVDTRPATNVTAGAAVLNGFLSITGASATVVQLYWGVTDGGTNGASWGTTNTLAAPQVPGALSVNVSGLDTNRMYFYRYAAGNESGARWADTTEVFTPGAVRATVTDGVALERDLSTGSVRFTRPTGATNSDLTVHYAVGGTAENGVDHLPISGAITIPQGAASATLTISPRRDALAEDQESVEITLLDGPYAVPSPGPAIVYIDDWPPGSGDLIWDNNSGDREWNHSSLNWLPNPRLNFVDADKVYFVGSATGRIYMGSATYTGSGFSGTTPEAVAPGAITVSGGIYEFEGGAVAAGTTLVSGGVLIDRNLDQNHFGSGRLTLAGGQFWRQIPPGTWQRTQRFTNDIVVTADSLLNGNKGDNFWDGSLELNDRLRINVGVNESQYFDHWFRGPLTLSQDTNFPNPRILYAQGRDGATHLAGNIGDDTNVAHTGSFPLILGSRKLGIGVHAGEVYVEGTNNTYSRGTVIAYWATEGNDESGVTVQSGSSLGTGPVTVEGKDGVAGARLTLNGTRAVRGALTLQSKAMVIINATNAIDDVAPVSLATTAVVVLPGADHVEQIGALWVGGVNAGYGYFDEFDYPANIMGAGRLYVRELLEHGVMLILR